MVTKIMKKSGIDQIRVSVPQGFTMKEPAEPKEKKQPRRKLRVGDYLPSKVVIA